MPTEPAARAASPSPSVERYGEGDTELWLPPTGSSRGPARRRAIFYNPAMALDRDLNVAFARVAERRGCPAWDAWEMLGATGVRGLRLVHETEAIGSLVITERDPEALVVLRRNAASVDPDRVTIVAGDATSVPPGAPFDYVDLDPYGSPIPFLPALFQALTDGAIAAVTATDMMVLAGVTAGACPRIYGARPVRGRLAPESGLRILLAFLDREARARGFGIHPLLSYVQGHHVRTYIAIDHSEFGRTSPVGTIDPATWEGPWIAGNGPFGPMWLGPLGDPEWVRRLRPPPVAACPKETAAFIARLIEESEVDRPFYYEPNGLARRVGRTEPSSVDALLAALRARGARAARGHPRAAAIRTDAPRAIVEEVARNLDRPV